jgi:two-component system sensor histidine kinase BaeS
VSQLYERSNSWEYLRQNPKAWFEIVGLPGGPGPATPSSIPQSDAIFPVAQIDPSGVSLRMSLTDAQQRFLIGYPDFPLQAPHRQVTSRGRVVGWLYLAPLTQVSNIAERRFQQRQRLLTWTIGAVTALIAALIAVMLSHAFLTPLRDITRTARALAAGRLDARVAAYSRDEIGQLALDVNQLAQSLEKNESARRNLMADVSHEFRTPLAVLRAELEALEDGVRLPTRESIHSLLSEVGTLNKLVTDIHDLAIADLGAVTYRRDDLNVGEVLSTCFEAFRGRFAQRRLAASIQAEPRPIIAFADEVRLQQLFNNLLENSARHTDPGGTVKVAIATDEREVRIAIEDSAPGVPPEDLPRLFERFFRVDSSRRRSTGGSGLGMAISRGIVEAHGGTITATASPLGGLRIDVCLPLSHAVDIAI